MKARQTQVAKHSFVFRFTPLLAVFISCLLNVHAQDSQRTRGFYPGASYAVTDIDTVNTKNGNLMLSVPTASLPPGRNGLSAGIGLFYDSKIFDTFTYNEPRYIDGPNTVELVASQDGGWRYGFQYEFQLQNRFDNYSVPGLCVDHDQTYRWKVKMKFPDGNIHVFRPQGYTDGLSDDYFYMRPDGWRSAACQFDWLVYTGTMTYYSADGTYLRLDVEHDSDSNPNNNPWTLYLADGGRVTGGGTSFERIYDSNNNYIEIQNITYNNHPATKLIDQVNRYIILEYGPAGEDYVYAWRNDENGQLTQLTWTIKWRTAGGGNQYYANPNDISIGITFYSTWVSAVDEIVLPAQSGGLSYKFGYNSDNNPAGWGEISSVTLPSGAKSTYQFSMDGAQAPYSAIETKDILIEHPTQKDFVYRPEYDLTSGVSNTPCNPSTETCITETWTFSYVGNNSPGIAAQTTGPDGGITKDYFQGTIPGAEGNPPFNPVFKSERPDGTMLETLWQLNYPNGCNGNRYGVNPYVKTEFTSIKNAAGYYAKTKIKDYNYDKNGNVTQIVEYDWVDYNMVPHNSSGQVTGIPGGATPLRVTTSTYYNSTPDASDTFTNSPKAYNHPLSPSLRSAVFSSEISAGLQTLARTEFTYDNPSNTGNLTLKTNWASTKGPLNSLPPILTPSNSISVTSQYNQYGGPTLTTDARNFQTQFVYDNVGGFPDLYATQITTAAQTSVQRTETREYDFHSGRVTRTTDVDNNVGSSTAYDVFGRPVLVRAAEGKSEEQRTATAYSDVYRRVIVRSDLNTVGDAKLVTVKHYDQLGRIRLERQLEDSTTQSATDETSGLKTQVRYLFSGSNNYQVVSNGYRAAFSSAAGSETSMGWTRTKSDNGGRLIEVQTFGGAGLPAPWGSNATSTGTVITTYDANVTTVSDQAQRLRRSMNDALGRLARIDEPDAASGNLDDGSGNPVQSTFYIYDPLGNLRKIMQGQQQRFFLYDSISRLIRARNPEQQVNPNLAPITDPVTNNSQWSIAYDYDDSGNLWHRTDARGVLSTFTHDPLNRITSITYSNDPANTPAVTRAYDGATYGKGRPWSIQTSGGSLTTVDSYDGMGRPTAARQQFDSGGAWGPSFTTTVTYDRAGHLLTEAYPSGRSVAYTYDGAGRANSFSGNLGDGTNRDYSTGIIYSAFGGLSQERFGTTTPIYNKLFYNSRGQLSEIREGLTPDNTSSELGAIINFYSTCWGMCSGQPMPDNNGNLKRQEHWIQDSGGTVLGIPSQEFEYDSLNRLLWVREGSSWRQQYSYDPYGNRLIDQVNTFGAGIPKPDFGVDTNTNRLTAPAGFTMSYDAAGNLINDTYSGSGQRIYDAENRMTQAWANNGWQVYTYDADGRRVKRDVNGVQTWQVFGLGGQLLAEYPTNGNPLNPEKEYGYRNGQLLIKIELPTASAAAPSGLGAAPGASVTLSWSAAAGATNYRVERRDASGSYVFAGATPSTGVIDSGVSAGTAYLYRVCSADSQNNCTSGYSNIALGAAVVFATDPIITGILDDPTGVNVTTAKVEHITELRSAVNAVRHLAGMGDAAWTHPTLTRYVSQITADDVRDLRSKLDEAVTALGVQTSSYDDQPLAGAPSGTLIKKAHITQLRQRTTSGTGGSGGASGPAFNIFWLVGDQLGTPRIIFDQAGSFATLSRHDYLPFGEDLFTGGRTSQLGYTNADSVRQKFTQKERDYETGLDFFGARYYSSTQGRFTGVDPSAKSLLLQAPQTLNRYSYSLNNPLVFVDPNGKWPTTTHNKIIDRAFNTLSASKREQIKRGSESVDANWEKPVRLITENTLIESLAYLHAMTPGSKVREMGREGAQAWASKEMYKYIDGKMGEAQKWFLDGENKDGPNNTALKTFGEGMHPVMDNISPAHHWFKVYDLAPYYTIAQVFGTVAALYQYKRDMDAHSAEEARDPTDDEMNTMVDEMRMRYLQTFGREEYEAAVSPEERRATEQRIRRREAAAR